MAMHPRPGPVAPRWLPRVALVVFVAAIALDSLVRLLVEVLWFEEVGAPGVLRTRLLSEFGLGALGMVVALGALWGSVGLAWRRGPRPLVGPRGEILQLGRGGRGVAFGVATLVALALGGALAGSWLDYRLALVHVAYGQRDPIFGRDIGFYLFTLPALRSFAGWWLGLVLAVLVLSALAYAARGALLTPRGVARAPMRHLGVLGGVALLLIAVQIWCSQFDILNATGRVIHGAAWADVHARLPGIRASMVTALLAAGVFVAGAWRGRTRWIALALGAFAAVWLLFTGLVPGLLQKLVVEPNELVKEKPYIDAAIRMTREAYDLESIHSQPFDLDRSLEPATVEAHRDVVDNIRLWDWRPLLATYGQIQEIRLYYNFGDVDIDRYMLRGQYRQVMLSGREMAYDEIPEAARTWVNLHLKYTHGYGLCMSPVNRITPEGLPELWIRDIPPVSTVGFEIRRPEIYYGEQATAFALVGTSTDEFDYPVGETNQSARYAGAGGIPVGGFGRRLAFAWYLRSREMLLTNYLTPDSKVLLRRSLQERAPRIAPFLRYDHDPYLVVDEGRLFWIQDAYTTSARFPDSRPVGDLNYIRNAVKVVVDAYDGTTRFYSARPEDPLLRAYAAVFPGLFRPLDTLPAGLRAHLRFPEDLFEVQTEAYATYHMQDAQVFYNREDLWARPVESVGGREQIVEPYYTIMRLPDGERPELVLMVPFTPSRKDNMVALLAARCDGSHLGEREVFLFPKQELVYGPRQIEARIDQDAAISQQLTLWSQHGSNVIRGNLLVVPVGHSLLYVEPLYLQADKGALPELKRVILSHADRIEMGNDLDTTLSQLVGTSMARAGDAGPAPSADASRVLHGVAGANDTARRALDFMRRAEAAAQRGDWAGSGSALQELRRWLESQAQGGAAPDAKAGTAP